MEAIAGIQDASTRDFCLKWTSHLVNMNIFLFVPHLHFKFLDDCGVIFRANIKEHQCWKIFSGSSPDFVQLQSKPLSWTDALSRTGYCEVGLFCEWDRRKTARQRANRRGNRDYARIMVGKWNDDERLMRTTLDVHRHILHRTSTHFYFSAPMRHLFRPVLLEDLPQKRKFYRLTLTFWIRIAPRGLKEKSAEFYYEI